MEDTDYELELELAIAALDDTEFPPETFYIALSKALERLKAFGNEAQLPY